MRYAVEYVCPGYDARDRAIPVGVVAQDESGVRVRAVPIDTAAAAAACGLPASALTRWESDATSRIMDPVFGRDGEPLPATDPAWLNRFAAAGMEAKFFFGPVQEAPGSGESALAALVAALAQP